MHILCTPINTVTYYYASIVVFRLGCMVYRDNYLLYGYAVSNPLGNPYSNKHKSSYFPTPTLIFYTGADITHLSREPIS